MFVSEILFDFCLTLADFTFSQRMTWWERKLFHSVSVSIYKKIMEEASSKTEAIPQSLPKE